MRPGCDEDYFARKEATMNVLGTAGFGRFLTDDQMPVKHLDVGESVFYALCGAVHGGQALYHSSGHVGRSAPRSGAFMECFGSVL